MSWFKDKIVGPIVMTILSSTGLKRKIAALISVVIGLSLTIPALQPFLPILQYLAGAFGVTGLAYGTFARTLPEFKWTGFASLIAFLITLAPTVPALIPFIPLLQLINSILGAFGLGMEGDKKVK